MRILFTTVTIISLALALIYGSLSASRKSRQARLLAWTSFCCAALMALYLCYITVDSIRLKEVFYSLQFAAIDWTMFSMFALIRESVEKPLTRTSIAILAIIFLIDSAIFISNPINGFAFDFAPHPVYDMFLVTSPKLFCFVHYALRFSVCAFMVYYVTHRVFTISKFYRGRYNIAFILFLAILVCNIYFLIEPNKRPDVTSFMITAGVVVLYYSIFYFSPNGLIRKVQLYVNDNISDATIIYDYKGDVLRINKKAKSLLEDNVWENVDNLCSYLGFPEGEGKYKKKIKGGQYEILYGPVKDEKENHIATFFIFYDVTKMEEQIEREHKIAITDPLTGAYNRKGFFEAANDFLYRNESQAGFALVISGICGFKAINASYGTKVGDKVLRFIEHCYHDYHHSYPMIYGRTSEGKFSALVPFDYVDELSSDLTSIDVPIDKDVDIHVDMAHGFVVLDDIAKPLDHYYERALLALAECKKNSVMGALEYSYEMEEQVKRRQLLVAEMHNALREGQFYIELQPQIELMTRKVTGAEALARWQHPKLGRISPAEFVPIFEENGFVVNLDVYIWELAAKTARELSDKGIYSGPVSINVSQIDIMGMDIAATLERIVTEVDIDPSRIHVEITESACAQKRDTLIRTMDLLRQKGFVLEIDDFGSGYSSLNALMKLPFDVIKLDMAFMKESNIDGKNGIIISSIVDMIHALQAQVIVEGVETEANVENTVRLGGDIVQGYYFSRPLSIDSFVEYVKSHRH